MNRYWKYYTRMMKYQLLYFSHGSKFDLNLKQRLFHNLALFRWNNAKLLVNLMYSTSGDLLDYHSNPKYLEFIESYKSSQPHYVEYWIKHKWIEVPDKYLKEFLAERYIDCQMDRERLLISNRDLFFYKNSNTKPTYRDQVDYMLSIYLEDIGVI